MKTTLDGLLNRRVMLEQPAEGFRVAVDTVLLAAAVPAKAGDRVLDLGCGAGGAMLCLACRVPGIVVTGVEIQEELAELCRRNISRNAFQAEMSVVQGDVTSAEFLSPCGRGSENLDLASAKSLVFAGEGLSSKVDPSPAKTKDLPRGKSKFLLPLPQGERNILFDHVLMNPPYHDEARHDVSEHAGKRAANTEKEGDLALWVAAAMRALKAGGMMTIVHRADRAEEIIALAVPHFGRVEILPILPKDGAPPKRILLRCQKGGSSTLLKCKPITLHRNEGGYSDEAEGLLRHMESLLFKPE